MRFTLPRPLMRLSLGLSLSSMLSVTSVVALGTAEEARAMLDQAMEAVKVDPEQAFSAFTAGAEGFRQDDLYVFCADDGAYLIAHGANEELIGKSMLDFQDSNGKFFLAEAYGLAMEGEVNQISYAWPLPGETELSQKVALFSKHNGILCAVGYYQ